MAKFEHWTSIEHTCGKVLGLLILGLFVSLGVFTSGTAYSQETGGRATDIKNKLDKISGPDPIIERIVVLEDMLNSEDPVLRSLAVEKALQIDDRRVREVALGYLVGTQKKFVVEVTISEKAFEEIKDPVVKPHVEGYLSESTIVLSVKEFDKKTGQFTVNDTHNNREGFIAQDGMTVILSGVCKLRLRNVESGYLIGALNCGRYSFAAKSALP